MRLSPDHIKALSQVHANEFGRRIMAFLNEHYPESRDVGASELLGEIHTQMARARNYGLTTEYELAAYVHTAWLLGPDFDRDFPAAATILSDRTLSAAEKARQLEQWSTALFGELDRGGKT